MAKDSSNVKRSFSTNKRLCINCRHSGGSPTLFCLAIKREAVEITRGKKTITQYRSAHGLDMLHGLSKHPHPFAHNINTDYRCLLFEPKPHKSKSSTSWGLTKPRKTPRSPSARKNGNDPK